MSYSKWIICLLLGHKDIPRHYVQPVGNKLIWAWVCERCKRPRWY